MPYYTFQDSVATQPKIVESVYSNQVVGVGGKTSTGTASFLNPMEVSSPTRGRRFAAHSFATRQY
jgi:hypothetical protein